MWKYYGTCMKNVNKNIKEEHTRMYINKTKYND